MDAGSDAKGANRCIGRVGERARGAGGTLTPRPHGMFIPWGGWGSRVPRPVALQPDSMHIHPIGEVACHCVAIPWARAAGGVRSQPPVVSVTPGPRSWAMLLLSGSTAAPRRPRVRVRSTNVADGSSTGTPPGRRPLRPLAVPHLGGPPGRAPVCTRVALGR